MSLTVTFSGHQSELISEFFPPILLDPTKNYVVGLIDFCAYNSIPNIEEGKNRFYVGDKNIYIPPGQYEISDLNNLIKSALQISNSYGLEQYLEDDEIEDEQPKEKKYFSLIGNPNTLKCNIESSMSVDFRPNNSVRELLGFESVLLDANEFHESTDLVKISQINVLQIECSIVTGSYKNGKLVHTLHEFSPQVPAGYKIVEVPSTIIYLPVNTHTIDNITVRIVNQNGQLVDLRGELITLRIHVKSL